MYVEQGEVGKVGDADVMLAQALAQAVREVGRNLATDPRRVQGMVSDVLGVESRTRRAEIDAVVLAAEESVPEDLLANRITMATALDRLHERGLDETVAVFAIDVWRYALGMLADDAQPPSLTNSLETSTKPAITDPAQGSINGDQPERFAAPAPVTVAYTVIPDGPHQPVVVTDKSAASKRNLLIGAGVAIVLVLGLVFVLASRGDDSTPTVDAGTTSEAATTTNAPTTTVVTTPTTVAVTEVVFAVEATPLGDLTRTWAIENGELVSTLVFNNTTGADTNATYYEVVPKSLAATADLITSVPAHTMVKNDPVISWVLPIGADQSAAVTYKIDVPDDATNADLDRWKSEQATEAAAFKTDFATAPVLTLVTPAELHIGAPDTDINGTVSPANALVSMAGTPIPINADGTWQLHVGPMPVGSNPYTITATNAYGQLAVTQSGAIVVEAPPEETAPPETTKPTTPKVTPPPGTPTLPPDPVTPPSDPAQPPPVPQPTPISVSISGPSSVFAGCQYAYSIVPSGFTPVAVSWLPGGATGSSTTFSFTGAGTVVLSVGAVAADGATASASKTVTVTVGAIPPGQPGGC